MKYVWILEKWSTREEMEKEREEFAEIAKELEADGHPKAYETLKKFDEKIKQNPEGAWFGIEGKTDYKQFCEVAKDAIRRAKKGCKFRAVKATINDDAKFWTGYANPVEHIGVTHYLVATK